MYDCINMYTVAIEIWVVGINNTTLNDWHCPIYATEIAHNSTILQFFQTSEDYSFIVNAFSAWHDFNFALIRLFLFDLNSTFFHISIHYSYYVCVGTDNVVSFLSLNTRVAPSMKNIIFR